MTHIVQFPDGRVLGDHIPHADLIAEGGGEPWPDSTYYRAADGGIYHVCAWVCDQVPAGLGTREVVAVDVDVGTLEGMT